MLFDEHRDRPVEAVVDHCLRIVIITLTIIAYVDDLTIIAYPYAAL